MKIQLVSHASVLLKTSDTQIWTDPWLVSKVFNDSWTMYPPPVFDESIYNETPYIWLSHEHPDHFNIPTLKAMPAEFKERVVILFQKKNTEKLFNALRAFGFRNFVELPNRKIVQLTDKTRVYCYQVGIMDSILGVMNEGETILNINDAKINTPECKAMLGDIKNVDVVLNQFSLAGYNGFLDYRNKLPQYAQQDIDNLEANHRDVKAKITIPFASFVYFSCADNRFVNEFANTPHDVYERMKDESVILYPGDTYQLGMEHDSTAALNRFEADYKLVDELEYDEPKRVELADIKAAFDKLAEHLHDKYSKAVLSVLKPVTVQIPDLKTAIRFSLKEKTFEELPELDDTDLIANSQPLHFGFKFPWGFQTLGVSARFFIKKNFKNWKLHRILFSINNAELYLRPKYFFRPKNLKYIAQRLPGGPNQLFARLERMN